MKRSYLLLMFSGLLNMIGIIIVLPGCDEAEKQKLRQQINESESQRAALMKKVYELEHKVQIEATPQEEIEKRMLAQIAEQQQKFDTERAQLQQHITALESTVVYPELKDMQQFIAVQRESAARQDRQIGELSAAIGALNKKFDSMYMGGSKCSCHK